MVLSTIASARYVRDLISGILQTFAIAVDWSLAGMLAAVGIAVNEQTPLYSLWKLQISQIAPVLPYLLLVLMLIFRPKGLLGTRAD